MQLARVENQWELLVCEPFPYISGFRVHVKHLCHAFGELGLDRTSGRFCFIQLIPRQGPGSRLYHVQLAGFLVSTSFFHDYISKLTIPLFIIPFVIVNFPATMKNSYEAYHLLEEEAEFEKNLDLPSFQPRSSRHFPTKGVVPVLITVISVSSLVVNIFLVYYIIQLRMQLKAASATQFGLSTVWYLTMS